MTEVSSPRNIYECADNGYLALSASMQSMWEKVAKMIGRPELITDPKYAGTAGPICNAAELLENEYIKGRGVLVKTDDDDHGTLSMHQVFPRLSETPGSINAQAPRLGQHTDEIMDLVGLTEQEKQGFIDRKVV